MKPLATVASRSAAPATADEFANWVGASVPAMLRLAARLAPVGADRDDIVQDALVQAWRKRGQYDARRGTPTAWLLAITADRARHAPRRRGAAILGEVVTRTPPAEEGIDLERAVQRLSGRQRLAVDCFYFAGLNVAETAAVMRCSQGTVKSTLSDARGRLRKLLEVK